MTDAKKQEVENKSEDPKKHQAAVINNPFDAYKSNPTTPALTNKEPKRKSSSSPEYRSDPSQDKAQRSRSRDNKQKPRASKQQKEDPYAQKKNKQIPHPRNSESDKEDLNNQQISKDEAKNEEAAYVKTKLCPLFDKGACKKGSACNYAHGEKELRGLPNFRKTRLCIPFKNGECSKSSTECKYAHGEAQLKKLVYDYFPPKHQQNYQNRGERQDRNHQRYDNRRFRERSRERQYRQHRDYSRDRQRHRDYRQRDRERQRDRDRDRDRQRDRERQRDRDRYHKDYHSSRNSSSIPPVPYPGYLPNYSNSAYMIPPSSMNPYGHPGQLYPPVSNSNSGLGGSNVPGSPSFSSSVAPNLSGNPYPPGPPLYGMGPAYDYSYGFMGQNYPPYNGSSV